MATLQDLSAKRTELNQTIATYTQTVKDFADGSATQIDVDNAKAAAQTVGDELAKLIAQVKNDDPNVTSDADLFSNPALMSETVRSDVATIMRTGQLIGPEMKLLIDTEAPTTGVTNVILSFATGSDITIDWGDGSALQTYTGAASHDYATPGQYEVLVTGTINGFTAANSTNARQIRDVLQWGDVVFASAESMFHNRKEFTISAPDGPKFAPGASCSYMFYACTTFNSDIGHWDMSNVVNTISMFLSCSSFNQPLNNWDVSGVTVMNGMFYQSGYNQPLNNWDVSAATSMYQMFRNATVFNQPLNNWNTANVTNMAQMFMNADAFLQDLTMWDVTKVTSYGSFADMAALYATRTDLHPNFV